MLYLANPSTPEIRAAMQEGRLGMMMTPKQGNRLPPGVKWAADNGAFTERGREGFTIEGYLSWLESLTWAREDCLFVTAPDVVGDSEATWEASKAVLPLIREMGFPAALVAQDGMLNYVIEWDAFDVLFLGGSTEWKLGPEARWLAQESKRRGKQAHMGRVNGYRRLEYADAIGCDSVDGTYLEWGPDTNLPKLLGWFDHLETPNLWMPL